MFYSRVTIDLVYVICAPSPKQHDYHSILWSLLHFFHLFPHGPYRHTHCVSDNCFKSDVVVRSIIRFLEHESDVSVLCDVSIDAVADRSRKDEIVRKRFTGPKDCWEWFAPCSEYESYLLSINLLRISEIHCVIIMPRTELNFVFRYFDRPWMDTSRTCTPLRWRVWATLTCAPFFRNIKRYKNLSR